MSEDDAPTINNPAEPHGVGGWLAFLIFVLIVLTPIGTMGGLLAEIGTAELDNPSISETPIWRTYKMLAFIGAIASSGLMCWAGVRLWRDFRRSTVRFALTSLWVGGVLIPIVTLLLIGFVLGSNPIGDGSGIGPMIGGMFWLIVWSLYLTRSRRVRNTYIA
jgi:hypothetical protein